MSRFIGSLLAGRIVPIVSAAALFLTLCSPFLLGQNLTSTASLSGIITDPQSARVPGAKVTLTSPQRNITRAFTTDSSGTYSFSLLQPGLYALKVDAPGFQTYERDRITLEVGQAAELNVALTLGSATEHVVVSGEAPLLTTDNANLGSEISGKQIVDLPLNYRNAVALIFLDSSVRNINAGYNGATVDTADQDITWFNLGGQFFGSTAFLLDGSWDGSEAFNGLIYVPSVDAIQEFKVQTNSFTAQYGMSSGSAIDIVTKSGADKFHGDVYEFFRNDALDANYYFNNLNGRGKTLLQMNQFGGALGGPINKNTFFFAAYEGLRLNNPLSTTLTTPTSPLKSGDFSGSLGASIGTDALCRNVLAGQIYSPVAYSTTATCAVPATPSSPAIHVGETVLIRDPIRGNNLAGMLDPVASAMLPYFPSPTNMNPTNNFFEAASVLTDSNELNARIDHNITDSARIYGRFSRKWEAKEQSAPFYGVKNPAGPGQTNPNNRYSVALGYNQVFSPTFTASFNFGFNRWTEGNISQGYPFKPSSLGLPSSLDPISPFFPAIHISGYAPLGSATEASFYNNIGTITADLVKVFRSHTLSFGYMGVNQGVEGGGLLQTNFSFNQAFTQVLAAAGPGGASITGSTGNAFASFLLGYAASGNTGVTLLPMYGRHYQAWYLQDDWKAAKRLTLNLGLRYDIQFPLTEKHNRQAFFDPTAVNPITALVNNGTSYLGALVYNNSSNRGYYKADYKDFSPRVGFAYQAKKNVVARGGFAIFYPQNFFGYGASPGYNQLTFLPQALNGGFTPDPGSSLSNAFTSGILPAIGNSSAGLTDVGQSVNASIRDRATTYIEQWSFGLQYSPTPKDLVEASYIGNHGLNLYDGNGINLNQLSPQYLTRTDLNVPVRNPFYGQPAMTGSSCGLANPMIPTFQTLLPMAEYCDNVTYPKANVGSSSYNALQVRYTHRATNGLIVAANYTLAKFLDNVSGSSSLGEIYAPVIRNNYDLSLERSVDENDIPNAAVVSFIYQLPIGSGRKIGSGFSKPLDAVLGGWEIAAINTLRQGTPLSINGNLNPGSVYGGGQHVNVVGDPNRPGSIAANPGCAAPSRIHTVQTWFNPCAFVPAAAGAFGDAPQYFSNLRAPGYADADVSLSKWFTLREAVRMQFRGEFYNLINRPNFGGPTVTFGSNAFGRLASADIARQIQLALKIYW